MASHLLTGPFVVKFGLNHRFFKEVKHVQVPLRKPRFGPLGRDEEQLRYAHLKQLAAGK